MATTQQDVIKNFMAVLDNTTSKGESALNEAISAVSDFSTYADFRAQLLSDCKAVSNADTFLRTYCGIILDNEDTGAITGSDAGGSTVKTKKSIVPESGSISDFTGNSFTVNGLTVKLANGDSSGNIESERTFDDLSEQEAYLWQALYTWWMSGGLDLIAESYGDNYSFNVKSAATKTMWIVLANEGSGTLAVTWGGPGLAQKCTSDLQLHINLYYYGEASGEDGIPNNSQEYLDRTIAHELTHAVMRANIDWFDHLPAFIKEGMAELTQGIDDVRTSSIQTLAKNSTKLGSAISLNTVASSEASYSGGYIFLRYLAHQNADYSIDNTTASTSVKTFYGNDTITNSASNVTISAGAGDDSIIGGGTKNFYVYTSGNDTIENFGTSDTLSVTGEFYRRESGNDMVFVTDDGSVTLTGAANLSTLHVTGTEIDDPEGKTLTVTDSTKSPVTINSAIEIVNASTRTKAVKITGNSLDNTITGGSGNDTLDGGKGDDVLTGGAGADIFILSAGDDTITDYGTGNDKISLGSSSVKNFGASGNDFVFDFGDRSLTLTDAANKKISVASGKTTQIFTDDGLFNTAGTAVTLSASKTTYTADSKVVTINASLTSGATVTGNTKANKVTFDGDGANVFVWQAKGGNDTLINFGSDSTLSVSGSVTGASNSGKNSVIKVGSTKITVKDSSQVTFTDDNGTRIFDSGIFYDKDKTSATLTTAVNSYTAKDNVTSVTGNAKNNTLRGSSGDTTLTGGKGNDIFINTGGNDYITDYGKGNDKISLGSSIDSFSVTDNNVALDLAKGSVTIANGSGKKISLVSGGKTTANIFTDDGIFNAKGTSVTLSASTTTYTAGKNVVTINASLTSNATVTGNTKANKVTFDDGANVFIWQAKGGNDTLINFGSDDTLKVSGTVSDGSVKSGNSFIKVGSNKITVKDTSLTIDDNNGTVIFDGGLFYDKNKTSVTLGSAVSSYSVASGVTNITGNAKANKIYANDAGDTLTGGKGNDSLWGGSGSDTFIYNKGDGKDYIFGFGSNDLLEIIGLSGNVTGSLNKAGTELTVKVGKTAVAVLKEYTATSFNINNTAYYLDGKTLTK